MRAQINALLDKLVLTFTKSRGFCSHGDFTPSLPTLAAIPMRCVLLITAAVASAFKASVRSGPSSLMEQLPPPPRIIVDRPAVGWIDEPNGKLRLRNVPGDASIVTVEKPDKKYFVRGGRKRPPSSLPPVLRPTKTRRRRGRRPGMW